MNIQIYLEEIGNLIGKDDLELAINKRYFRKFSGKVFFLL